MTPSQILRVQDLAVRTGNRKLLATAWRALGHDSQLAFMPVSKEEQAKAIDALKDVRV